MKLTQFQSTSLQVALDLLRVLRPDLVQVFYAVTTVSTKFTATYDSASERWQEGEAGQLAEATKTSLNEVDDAMTAVLSQLDTAMETIEDCLNNAA